MPSQYTPKKPPHEDREREETPALTLTSEQFQELLRSVAPPPPPPPPEPSGPDPNVWTWDRVKQLINSGEMKTVTFIPEESVPISWNGLTVWVAKGVENVVPEVHYHVYMQSRLGTAEAFRNARETLARRSGGQFSEVVGWAEQA